MMDQPKKLKTDTVNQELFALREEIKNLAIKLELAEDGETIPTATEMIETLKGISQGAFSCAELLQYALLQSGRERKPVHCHEETRLTHVREEVVYITKGCSDLSHALRRLRRDLLDVSEVELERLGNISQQVQSALENISSEWETLS